MIIQFAVSILSPVMFLYLASCGPIKGKSKQKKAPDGPAEIGTVIVLGSLSEEFGVVKPTADHSRREYQGGYSISHSSTENEFTCVAPSHILQAQGKGFYISCSVNNRVVYIDGGDLKPKFALDIKEGSNPMGLALLSDRSLAVASWAKNEVRVIGPDILEEKILDGNNSPFGSFGIETPKNSNARGAFPSTVVGVGANVFVSLNNIGDGFKPVPAGGYVLQYEMRDGDLVLTRTFETLFANTNSVNASSQGASIYALSAGSFAGAGYAGNGGLSIINIAEQNISFSIPLPSPSAIVELDGGELLVSDLSSAKLYKVNPEKGSVHETDFDFRGDTSCKSSALNAGSFISSMIKVGSEIYLTEFSSDCLVILDAQTLAVKDSMKVVDGPVGLAVLEKSL